MFGETLESAEHGYLGLAVCPTSPNIVAVATWNGFFAEGQSKIDVWNVQQRKKLWSPPTEFDGYFIGVAFSNSGKSLAACGAKGVLEDPIIEIWDFEKRGPEPRRIPGFAALQLAFSRNDSQLAAVGGYWGQGACRIFNISPLANRLSFDLPIHEIPNLGYTLSVSPTGGLLAAGNLRGGFRVWNWEDWDPVINGKGLSPDMATPSFLGDDRSLAVTTGRELEFWRIDTKRRVGSLRLPIRVRGGCGFAKRTAFGCGRMGWTRPVLASRWWV